MLDDRTHNKHTRVQITNPLELFPWQVRLLLYRCTLSVHVVYKRSVEVLNLSMLGVLIVKNVKVETRKTPQNVNGQNLRIKLNPSGCLIVSSKTLLILLFLHKGIYFEFKDVIFHVKTRSYTCFIRNDMDLLLVTFYFTLYNNITHNHFCNGVTRSPFK